MCSCSYSGFMFTWCILSKWKEKDIFDWSRLCRQYADAKGYSNIESNQLQQHVTEQKQVITQLSSAVWSLQSILQQSLVSIVFCFLPPWSCRKRKIGVFNPQPVWLIFDSCCFSAEQDVMRSIRVWFGVIN